MSEIEYFYAAHSAFAYFGSRRLMQIAQAANRRIKHKPIDLSRVLKAAGALGFRERTAAHRAYYFGREIDRWSQFRNAPVMGSRPTYHDNDVSLANCVLICIGELGESADELAHLMLQAHWRDDADLADRSLLHSLIQPAGFDADALLASANTPEIRSIYNRYTDEAIERSVFGSPTYFVDGDMFYGQDRLEMVERALQQPFSDSWPAS